MDEVWNFFPGHKEHLFWAGESWIIVAKMNEWVNEYLYLSVNLNSSKQPLNGDTMEIKN